jgi:DNA-binding MarR family transcriptional regulator
MNTNELNEELVLLGESFAELYDKYSKMTSKKFLYKEIKDLTIIEINTILVIGKGDKTKRMSEIADILGVTYGTPTVTIDRLIKKGYVERFRDEEDRRQVFIKLSPLGQETFNAVRGLKNKISERIFGILDKEQRSALVNIISTLDKNFDSVCSSNI